MNKEQIRLKEISKIMDTLNSKDVISDSEEREFNSLNQEADKIMRSLEANNVKGFLNDPEEKGKGFLFDDRETNTDTDDIKVFDKRSLDKYKEYIRSRSNLKSDEKLSFGKLILGMVTGDWRGREAEKRAMGTSTSGAGNLIPEAISHELIPLALNKSQVITAGARVIPFETKTLLIPKIAEAPAVGWKVENESFSESDGMTFSGVELTAKTIMALIKMSVELAQDGYNVEQIVENEIAKQISLEIDRAALDGSGVGQEPTGLFYADDILEEDVGNAELTDYSPFSKAYTKVENENGIVRALIAPSQVYGDLDLLTDENNQPLNPPASWGKYRQLSSNQISGKSVLGDWSQVVIGMRSQINIQASGEAGTAYQSLQIWVRAFVRCDIGIMIPEHLCKITNIGAVSS